MQSAIYFDSQSGNSVIGLSKFLKRRMISARLAAVQKYCCLRRSSLPTANCQMTGMAMLTIVLTRSVVIRVKDRGDCSSAIGRLDSAFVVPS